MILDRALKAAPASALIGSLLLSGCVFHHFSHSAPSSGAPVAASAAPAAASGSSAASAPSDQAAAAPAITHADTAPADAAQGAAPSAPAGATDSAPASAPPAVAVAPVAAEEVNPSAPMRYTVKHGDTLWGIAAMFLRDPWQWPEIWYVNPQVRNPHLIYPGDVLALAHGTDGGAQIRLERGPNAGTLEQVESSTGGEAVRLEPSLRSSPLNGAIPTISSEAIAAFLSKPAMLSAHEVDQAAHVLAFRDEHQAGGAGDEAYVQGVDAPVGTRFVVMHIGEQIIDPDTHKVLGYQGLYTATATVVRAGNPAKVVLAESARETLRGDCLFAESAANPLTFIPRAPSMPVHGRIASVIDDVHLIGQYDIVALNLGARDGLEPGSVLAVDTAGALTEDRGTSGYDMWGKNTLLAKGVRLPSERAGTVLVFKTYDDLSYALVVGASEPMRVADVVHNP